MAERSASRRRFLTYSGIAGALMLTAGCIGGDEEPADDADSDGDSNDDTNGDDSDGNSDDDATLHERYGYPSTAGDEAPPVESDHEVDLLMDPPADEDAHPTFYFDPAGLAVETGDVVRFNFSTPDHAVAAFHQAFGRTQRVPEDAEPVSSPMMETGTYWLCEFTDPGVWDLYCPPHEPFGMGMRVVVGEEATGPGAAPVDPQAETEYRPPSPQLTATYNAEALDPEAIISAGEVAWADVDRQPPEGN